MLSSACLRNALLSLACTYILDYLPDEKLRVRANDYYHAAVTELDKMLSNPDELAVGKGDDLVGCIALLNMHDVSD